jgi:AcrR family transcriptional regulator
MQGERSLLERTEDTMPRISAEREEATRQRILKAARSAFVEKGFATASIDDVVAASGLSVGAIYTYFRNKDELIRASIDTSNRVESEALLADAQSASTGADRMQRAIRSWWQNTMEVPGGPAFLAEAWAAAARRPLIRDLMTTRHERGVTVISILLREGMARGELPAGLPVDDLARTFGALVDGLVLEYIVSGGTLRRAEAERRIMLLLNAARAAAAG